MDSRISEVSSHITSKATCGEWVGSLLGGTGLNYVGHQACAHRASARSWKERERRDMVELARRTDIEVIKRGSSSIGLQVMGLGLQP